MFLRNYTSEVPVTQTIARIEAVLLKCGVSAISKEYSASGTIAAMRFEIQIPDAPKFAVRLPADKDHALDALWSDYQRQTTSRRGKRREDFAAQAERTAWALMRDWVEVQMSMISLKQADTLQVFLPYLWDGKQTYYQRLQGAGFKALLPERST